MDQNRQISSTVSGHHIKNPRLDRWKWKAAGRSTTAASLVHRQQSAQADIVSQLPPGPPPQFYFLQKANKEKKRVLAAFILLVASFHVHPVRALVSPPPPNCRAPAGHECMHACAAFGRQASRSTTEARAAPTRGREEHRAVQGFLPR